MAARKLKRSEHLPESSEWELLVRLAQGGMGAVFLGVRRGTREPIYAIKRAHAHLLEEPEFRKMFSAEARLALQIRHPNAIGVRAVDETDGELMLIMDYFEGGSFGELLAAAHEDGRKLPPRVVLRIALDAARGLDAAHRLLDASGQPLGVVHRDVSPQNILVGVDGRAAIVDFGVAKAASVEATRTATEVLKGKTAYMAPEYLRGRIANPQTDVFSLSIVTWEALANRRLFKREDEVATMQAILAEPAPLLSDLMSVDQTLSAIVARGLTKDPVQRFRDAREFADALESRARTTESLASAAEVSAAVKRLLGDGLEERRGLIADAIGKRDGVAPIGLSGATVPTPYQSLPPTRHSEPSQPQAQDSHPFQVLDTPRRVAITAPQAPRARPPQVLSPALMSTQLIAPSASTAIAPTAIAPTAIAPTAIAPTAIAPTAIAPMAQQGGRPYGANVSEAAYATSRQSQPGSRPMGSTGLSATALLGGAVVLVVLGGIGFGLWTRLAGSTPPVAPQSAAAPSAPEPTSSVTSPERAENESLASEAAQTSSASPTTSPAPTPSELPPAIASSGVGPLATPPPPGPSLNPSPGFKPPPASSAPAGSSWRPRTNPYD